MAGVLEPSAGEVVPPASGRFIQNRGLVQSMVMRAQRDLVEKVATSMKSPALFLKAAWSDPVLYGGVGERYGTDMDLLVRPDDFTRFVDALSARGFRPFRPLEGTQATYFEAKELSLLPPPGSAYLTIDLHRALSDPGWFNVSLGPLFERAVHYDSPHGPIPSLSPEDQVVYACLHYAVHIFDLDERHLRDVHRMLSQRFRVEGKEHNVDWRKIKRLAKEAGVEATMCLLLDALRELGTTNLPKGGIALHDWMRARLVRGLIGKKGVISRARPRSRALDYGIVRPLLSDDRLAGPRFWWRYGRPWVREAVLRSTQSFGRLSGPAGPPETPRPCRTVIHVIGSPLPARTFAAPMVRWLREHGWDAHLWVGNHPPGRGAAAHMGVDYLSIDSELLGTPWTVATRLGLLYLNLRKCKPAIVHVHLTRSSSLPLLAAFAAGVPTRIYHNHGLACLSRKGLLARFALQVERMNMSLATRVLFSSRSTERAAVEAGLIDARSACVPADGSDAGIDLQAFPLSLLGPEERQKARMEFGLPPEAFVLGFVGRPVPHKGLGLLLDAWKVTRTCHSGGYLLIAGSTVGECEKLWGRPLLPSTRALGYRADLLPFYATCDAIALPSAYEGFPNALLEAAAACRPTLGSHVPGTEDAIVHEETGLLIEPPGDASSWGLAIDRLAFDASGREKMGIVGRQRVERLFERERVMSALVGCYGK